MKKNFKGIYLKNLYNILYDINKPTHKHSKYTYYYCLLSLTDQNR